MKLLLIIDMQEGFRSQESEQIIPKILKLIHSFNGKIVFSKFINEKNSLFEKQLGWKTFQTLNEQEILSELVTKNKEEIKHKTYSILNKEMKKFIENNKITEVYLCGIFTDVCIIKTAMDLFDNNITNYVIEDACNSLHGINNHKYAINSLKHILGKKQIIQTRELLN